MIRGNHLQIEGYTLVRDEKNQRIVYECDAKQICIDGKLRKCSKRYRINRVPKVCKHMFNIVVQTDPISEKREKTMNKSHLI